MCRQMIWTIFIKLFEPCSCKHWSLRGFQHSNAWSCLQAMWYLNWYINTQQCIHLSLWVQCACHGYYHCLLYVDSVSPTEGFYITYFVNKDNGRSLLYNTDICIIWWSLCIIFYWHSYYHLKFLNLYTDK